MKGKNCRDLLPKFMSGLTPEEQRLVDDVKAAVAKHPEMQSNAYTAVCVPKPGSDEKHLNSNKRIQVTGVDEKDSGREKIVRLLTKRTDKSKSDLGAWVYHVEFKALYKPKKDTRKR